MKRTLIVMALLLTIIISACATVESSDTLMGSWKLTTINGQPVIEGSNVTAKFENNQVSGKSGCNSYSGSYSITLGKLTFSAIAMTEMACGDPAGIMDQESAFFDALNKAANFSVNNGNLEIKDASGETLLVFSAE